jgi:DNA-binding GntR family transcriptional regulator
VVHSPPGRPHSIAPAIPLLTDRAYERIKHDIITCAFAPGTAISEPQLCAHYRLGKAPVRMALIRLAHDGLVRAIPRRGYMVAPVTLKDIHDVFELRLLLEPPTARMAAGKVEAQRLRALDEACRAGYQPEDAKSISRFLEASKAFQIGIAQATGNTRLAAMTAQLFDQMTRLLHLGLGIRNRSQEMRHAQRGLAKALARGDGDAAERISREQIEAARNMVLGAIMRSSTVLNLAITGDHG